jgi:hypothetical protein
MSRVGSQRHRKNVVVVVVVVVVIVVVDHFFQSGTQGSCETSLI